MKCLALENRPRTDLVEAMSLAGELTRPKTTFAASVRMQIRLDVLNKPTEQIDPASFPAFGCILSERKYQG